MENTVIQLSAGELAEYCFPEGSLGAMPSIDRMLQGTAAHKKLQNIYSENENIRYQREVPLENVVEYDGFSLKIQGRADGIFFDKKDYFIHEIKSTYCKASSIHMPLKAAHKAQMMIYAYIYAKEHSLPYIQGRLSYFCLLEEKIVDFEYRFSFENLQKFFYELTDEYSRVVSRRLQAYRDFLCSARTLHFPFPHFRKGQREGAAQIYSAIKQNKNLFLQAPTGSGKTMMALFPAIKNMAQGDIEKIFCLSAKNQTMQVNEQALNLLRRQGLKIKSCVITAKSKACLMEDQDCSPEKCPYSQDFYKKLHDALPEILEQDDFCFDTIAAAAKKYEICPYELSLELSLEAQVILADYNYLFDPMVYLRRYFEQSGPYAFLIDEAHNLIERGRDMYSSSLSKNRIRAIKKLLPKESRLYRRLTQLSTELNKLFKNTEAEAPIALEAVKKINFKILAVQETAGEFLQTQPLPGEVTLLLKDAFRFQMLFAFFYEDNFALYHQDGETVVLQCLDPAPYLEESIAKGCSAILYSATLIPYEFYKNSLLPQKIAYGFSVPYPFYAGRLMVLADYSVDTRYTVREQFYGIIAQKIKRCRENAVGNLIVYFPSFQFMHAVAQYMQIPILMQESDSTAEERAAFTEQLLQGNANLAFAVMGSHFSEGIDLRGIRGIIIVGVALPQYNFSRERIRIYFDKQYQKGFEYAYVYPGINKVCQAAGRLIRTEEDAGFILLMDRRFKNYKHLLPPYWQITETENEEEIYQHITAFDRMFHQ